MKKIPFNLKKMAFKIYLKSPIKVQYALGKMSLNSILTKKKTNRLTFIKK